MLKLDFLRRYDVACPARLLERIAPLNARSGGRKGRRRCLAEERLDVPREDVS
jgi:hypothetical protein